MTTSITVRDLGAIKHQIDKYAMTFIYLPGKNESGASVKALIYREIHLVNGLKANMLIRNDILGPEKIDILVSSSTAHIKSCNVTIPIIIQSRSVQQNRPVHSTKTLVISPHSEMLIPVHSIRSLPDRDYLFEPTDSANFAIYAHLVDIETKAVLARNEHDKSIKIPRNFRLGRITELEYINAHLISVENTSEIINLGIRRPKAAHKSSWFAKVLIACAAAYAAVAAVPTATKAPTDVSVLTILTSPTGSVSAIIVTDIHISLNIPEITHSSGVIIHNSSAQAIDEFSRVIEEYFTV